MEAKAKGVGFLFKDGKPIPVNKCDLCGSPEYVDEIFKMVMEQKENNITGYMFIIEGGKK